MNVPSRLSGFPPLQDSVLSPAKRAWNDPPLHHDDDYQQAKQLSKGATKSLLGHARRAAISNTVELINSPWRCPVDFR